MGIKAGVGMNLQQIWQELQSYDGNSSKSFQLNGCKVQFYKGAMEIPLIAFIPQSPFQLEDERMKLFAPILSSLNLELDCVEDGTNYKINRKEDHQYLGRITKDALKLHASRIQELGWDGFQRIVTFFLMGEFL